MRRLTAYRERDIQVPSTVNLGKLTISEKYRVSTTSNALLLAFRFVYNYTKYAVILSKKDGAELNATNLTALGIATDEVIIVVEMKRYKIWVQNAWYLEQPIAQFVAAGLGMVIESSTFDGSNTVTVLRADSYAPQKVVTSIANVNATYLNSVTASTEEITIYTKVPEKYDFFDLNIDDKTAIGISFEGFNPEKPESIGLKTSNAFSIPDTPTNARMHGFYGSSLECYDPWFVNYIIDNNPLISGGKIKITDVNDGRISCTITAKSNAWDKLKGMLWADFMYEIFYYLQKPESANYSTFIDLLIANENVSTRAFYGDLHGDSTLPMIDRDIKYKSDALNELVYIIAGYQGGLLTTSVKVVFDFIKVYFGIDFVTNSTVFNNVNSYFQNRYLKLNRVPGGTIYITYTRGFSNGSTAGVKMDKGKKTVYDFVKEFIIHAGCLVDVISEREVALNRMDDLLLAPVVDFSGNIDKGSIKFLPFIEGVGQNNYIDFAEYSPKIPKGSLKINNVCLNKNVETAGETLELKEFAPPAYIDRDKYVLGLFDDGSWDNFTFMQDSGYTAEYRCLSYFNLAVELQRVKTIPIAKIMDVGYSLWAEIIKRPKAYKIKKWLTAADINNLKLYQRYWIKELQGIYMLKKVSGLNPEKSNDATEMEFIKIVDPNIPSNFGIVPDSLFPDTAGSITPLDIYTGSSWNILGSYDWISLSKSYGGSRDQIDITVSPNSGTSDKVAVLSVNSFGETRELDILQKPLIVTPASLEFTLAGGIKSLSISLKGAWSISTSDSWIIPSATSGNNDTSISIRVLRHELNRTGTVTVSTGSISRIIIIEQS